MANISPKANDTLLNHKLKPGDFKRDKDIKEGNGTTSEHYYNKDGNSLYIKQDKSADYYDKSGNQLFHDGAPVQTKDATPAAAPKSDPAAKSPSGTAKGGGQGGGG